LGEWLSAVTEPVAKAIDGVALLTIVVGTFDVFVAGWRLVRSSSVGQIRRDIWLRYARWLVAALTFQLAADIIETSVNTNWDDIGRLGAIAVIRTFLDYFLGREVKGESSHA